MLLRLLFLHGKNQEMLKSFVVFWVLLGYYRKFIHNHRKIVEPLTNLLKKNSFTWSPCAAKAFHTLKLAVSSAPA